jgi:lactate permease
MDILAFFLPFLVLVLLVVVGRRPLWLAGLVALGGAMILWALTSEVKLADLMVPLVKAGLVAFEIGLILLGAIGFLSFMQSAGFTDRIKDSLFRLTAGDMTAQVLLLAWLFVGFIEGAAGFGTPAAIVAPLLMSLGFRAHAAAVIPLIGDSTAVPFGAVGTPVRVGFEFLASGGVSRLGAGINLVAGLIAPFFIVKIMQKDVRNANERGSQVRLALWAGFCFTAPAFLFAFLGPEFPSLIGALVGMMLFIATLRLLRAPSQTVDSSVAESALWQMLKAFYPYLFLCLGLLLGKLVIGPFRFELDAFGGSYSIAAFQPGLVFILVMISLKLGVKSLRRVSLLEPLKQAGDRLPPVFLAIFCMASLAQFMIRFAAIDQWLAIPSGLDVSIWQNILIAGAPFIGALGSFIAGSATVSNLLFAGILADLSHNLGLDISLVLALQLVGAGIGNMIALQNLTAVQATVGLKNAERDMLRDLALPCLYYAVATSLIGLLIFHFEPK